MTKIMDNGKVLSQDELSKDIFSVWIRTDIAKYAAPGQFWPSGQAPSRPSSDPAPPCAHRAVTVSGLPRSPSEASGPGAVRRTKVLQAAPFCPRAPYEAR